MKIDFDRIISQEIKNVGGLESNLEKFNWNFENNLMKQAVLAALPLILKHAADKATTKMIFGLGETGYITDKQSILDCQSDIINELGL